MFIFRINPFSNVYSIDFESNTIIVLRQRLRRLVKLKLRHFILCHNFNVDENVLKSKTDDNKFLSV